MKLAIKLSLFLFTLVIFGGRSFALSDYQIKKICSKERGKSACIKNLKEKRLIYKKVTYSNTGNTI